ncbi:MAG: hypothetical protein K1X64_00945 [Myxococcaceae bacterium]|nr:hypothetical protein [Myxococcaceae bacterium]
MSAFTHLLLAQVGTGRIQGGWEYIWACYIITWTGIVLYAVSLWARQPKE